MTVLRVCYKSGIRFDDAYYLGTHCPLAAGVFGRHGLRQAEMVKVSASGDGSTPPYQVIFSAYFDSAAALQEAMGDPRMSGVIDDIRNFYDGMPDLLIGETVALPAPA